MTETTDNTDESTAIGKGLVLYDAACGICRTSVGLSHSYLQALGFRMLPLQSPRATELTGTTPAALFEELNIVMPDRQILRGPDAVLHLARASLWTRPLSWLAHVPGARPILRSLYRAFARRRYRLSAACGLDRRQKPSRLVRWMVPTLLVSGALAAGDRISAWAWMWSIALAIYFACKWLTWWPARRSAPSRIRSLAYLFAWPGMDARAFFTGSSPPRPSFGDWMRVGLTVLTGATFIWIVPRSLVSGASMLAGWTGMIGLAMVCHFGLLHLLALAWQSAGVDAQPLMRRPIGATSLADFWGRRWNTAFHKLVRDLIFTPLLRRRFGVTVATAAVFIVSGLVHDLVISLPARSGFGLPTVYFTIQLAGVLLERTALARRTLHHRVIGRAWTLAFTLLPLPLLFHAGFVQNVFLPFLHAIGGLP